MSVEAFKAFFDVVAQISLFLTFAAGLGALVTGNIINKRQVEQLKHFDSDLTAAKTDLGKQQERAANADAKVAGLEKAASDAKAAQQKVETQLAIQQQATALAEQHAAEANLALAKLKLPRTLSPEQQQRIVAELRPSTVGQQFSFSVVGDSEALDLLATIRAILNEAGWVKGLPVGFGDIKIGDDAALGYGRGVIVRFSPNAQEGARQSAALLSKYLNSEQIASAVEVDKRVTDPTALNVLVGTKPMR